jgi:hypothetical protein
MHTTYDDANHVSIQDAAACEICNPAALSARVYGELLDLALDPRRFAGAEAANRLSAHCGNRKALCDAPLSCGCACDRCETARVDDIAAPEYLAS